MPLKLKTRCRHRGCPAATRHGYCDQHVQERYHRVADRQRGSSSERGYDQRWRHVRDIYVRQHPICEVCLEQGTVTLESTLIEVDHIIPIMIDPSRRLDSTNLQSLCRRHHQLKTLQDQQQYGGALKQSNGSKPLDRSDQADGSDWGGGGQSLPAGASRPRGSQRAHFREIGDRGGRPAGPGP